jgi:glycosyltransferase involved in cell wall biosynthesis
MVQPPRCGFPSGRCPRRCRWHDLLQQVRTRRGRAHLVVSTGGSLSSVETRLPSRLPRIFLGLTEICGYYANLRSGLSELGVPAEFVALEEHPFQYGEQQSNWIVRWAQHSTRRRQAARHLAGRTWWGTTSLAARLLLFLWALARFDVFIFGFGSTFFRTRDLPLIKLLGKKVICVFHGSDERPPYLSGYIMGNGGPSTEAGIALAASMKHRIKRIERYADVVVSHPLSAHLHERPIVPFLLVGIGYRMASLPCPKPPPVNGVVRILHAPSRPGAKGTPRIRAAVARLRAKGHPVELVEIMNRPNAEVLEEMARCDLVVDEVWSDIPMAGFAAEAACYGKPAVVGGYGWDLLREMVPSERFPPSQICHPDELEDAIEQLVANADYRKELGSRARRFVESQWTCRKVAESYLDLIQGRNLDRWLHDPKGRLYLHGCGMEERQVRQTIRAFIEQGGRRALQVSDRPDWEAAFARFAGLGDD